MDDAREHEYMDYTATLDTGEEVQVEARSLLEAAEMVAWTDGYDHFILSVEQQGIDYRNATWILTDLRTFTGRYDSKHAALANNDTGDTVLIAIPVL